MTQFYPHDAHVKTHREFIEEQKRRMKSIYRIQKYFKHHKNMRKLQNYVRNSIASKKTIRKRVA